MGNAHSSIGPSAADRWVSCPGSIALSAKCPPQKPSYPAAEGSVAHKIAEDLVLGRADEFTLMSRIGETVQHDGHEVTIIEEMLEGARLYKDVIDKDHREMLASNRAATIHRHCELRIPVKDVDKECFGTLDYAQFQKGNRIVVYDYKFGKGHMVSPRENRQAGLYYIGVEDELAGKAFDKREIVIVQPRALGSEADRVKRWDVDVKWLASLRMEARAAIKMGREPNPPFKAGDHRRWCPAQAVCREFAERVQLETQADFATTPAEVKEGQLVEEEIPGLPNVQLMSVEKMTQALNWEDAISAWFGSLRARAQGLLEAGQEVPGYKLVDGRSNRKWADDTGEQAASYFAPKYGHRVYAPKKPLSPAQMEKLVGKGNLPAGFCVKPPAGKKLAKADDARPAALTTAQEDFGAAPAQIEVDAPPTPAQRDLSGLHKLLEEKGVAPRPPYGEGLQEHAIGAAIQEMIADPLADDPLAEPVPAKRDPFWPQ